MPSIYNRKWSEVIDSGHSKKVYSKAIEPGLILKVLHASFYTAEKEANDNLQIVLDDKSQAHIVLSRASSPLTTSIETRNPIYLGETDRLYGYAPDSDTDDTIMLSIHGVLMTVEEFLVLEAF